MTQDIHAYMDADDQVLVDFTHRLKILADEELVCKTDFKNAIELISMRHLVHERAFYGSFGVTGGVRTQLLSICSDLELAEHYAAGHLVLENKHLSGFAQNLLDAEKAQRVLSEELIAQLTNGSPPSAVKQVRKRFEASKDNHTECLNAFADAIKDSVGYQRLDQWSGQIEGIPTLMFGYWDNPDRLFSDREWRDSLSANKKANIEKGLARKPLPVIGRRRKPDEIRYKFLEEGFSPVFRIQMPDDAEIDGYVPTRILTQLYVSLNERWIKRHIRFENKVLYSDSEVKLTLFRKKINVKIPPSFLSPKQILHDLVTRIIAR